MPGGIPARASSSAPVDFASGGVSATPLSPPIEGLGLQQLRSRQVGALQP